jgi:hypothetical protein
VSPLRLVGATAGIISTSAYACLAWADQYHPLPGVRTALAVAACLAWAVAAVAYCRDQVIARLNRLEETMTGLVDTAITDTQLATLRGLSDRPPTSKPGPPRGRSHIRIAD